jgi:hypothetical protein
MYSLQKIMKIFISYGSKKIGNQGVTIPSGTTQGNSYMNWIPFDIVHMFMYGFICSPLFIHV